MRNLQIVQITIAILLMLAILLQNRGVGLSGVFGGSGNIFRTKRGIEKKIFVLTIVLSVLFFLISLAVILLYKGWFKEGILSKFINSLLRFRAADVPLNRTQASLK